MQSINDVREKRRKEENYYKGRWMDGWMRNAVIDFKAPKQVG
jgi:hypothetical protein